MYKRTTFNLIILLLISLFFETKAQDSNKIIPLVVYKLDSLWYFLDSNGKQIFPPQELTGFAGYKDGFFRVGKKINGKTKIVYLNMKGEVAIVPECDGARNFSDGLALVMKYKDDAKDSYLYGFINNEGKQVIPYKFTDALDFSEGLAYARDDEHIGYIDKAGKYVITLKEGTGASFMEGLAPVANSKNQVGYIDTTGKLVIDYQYDDGGYFSEGLAYVGLRGKYGYITQTGQLVIPAFFDYAYPYKEGRAVVGRLDTTNITHYGLANVIGNPIINFVMDDIRGVSEDVFAFKTGGKWGYKDKNGNTVLEPQFSYAESFVNGLAWASKDDGSKYGFINKEGKYIITIPKSDFIVDLRLNHLVN